MPEEEEKEEKPKIPGAQKAEELGKKIGVEGLDKLGKIPVGPLPLGGWCLLISCGCFLVCALAGLMLYVATELGLRLGVRPEGCQRGGGCFLVDEAFTKTDALQNADEVIQKLSKYKALQTPAQKQRIQQIIDASKAAGINPAILIAFWAGEQSFGNPDAAFGCGVYGGKNRNPSFEKQINCALNCIKQAIDKTGNYATPIEANTWNRLLYNYVDAARALLYQERGYVSDANDDPRIEILQQLVPDQVTCSSELGYWQGDWLTGNNIIKKPATNPWIKGAHPITPEIIVMHYSDSVNDTADSLWAYFNEGAEGRKVWTQFIVGQDGKVYQLAPANTKAAHVGTNEYDECAIGIEGAGNFEKKPPSEAQYNAYLNLVKSLIQKYNIPKTNIYGHAELVDCRRDPGKDFLRRIWQDLGIDPNNPHGSHPRHKEHCPRVNNK